MSVSVAAKYVLDLLIATYRAWRADRVIRMGAGLAYYALFAIVPLVTIIVSIAGFFFTQIDVASVIADFLDGIVDAEVESIAAEVSAQIDGVSFGTTGLVSIVALVFAASLVFIALQDSLNVIWHEPVRTGITQTIRRRVMAFGVVLLMAGLFLAQLVVQSIVGLAEKLVPGDVDVLESLAGFLASGASAALGVVTITLVLRLLPYEHVPWRDAIIGATVASVLIAMGSWGFGWYIQRFGTTSVAGAAGSIAVFLLWLFMVAQIVLAAAVLTRKLGDTAESSPDVDELDAERNGVRSASNSDAPAREGGALR